uniref:ABC transporter G family member 5 n=1 Tax=Anthurium amnicola TaxID=1678845 RepID=A0A1D1ZEY9_9ARAE
MKAMKGGCEVEARCVSYKIRIPQRAAHPFKIWSRDDGGGDDAKAGVEETRVRAPPPTHHSRPGLPPEGEPRTTHFRHVLKNVSCRAKPWEVLAIVGPSGAGKSTLLEILAGRLPTPTPAVFVDQKPVDQGRFRKISGYVTQRDTLFPLLTVRETLHFSARLRLGLPHAELAARVETLLQELGLDHVAGVRIGDDKVRGVSGGERRRVSIGVDVIHDPRVLILDEPTSGLDSTSALQIVDMLRSMAETQGRTVILSIHQPGFRIVKLFSSLLLLADGSVLHHGTVDQLQAQLGSLGLQVPLHVNAVEFAMDAIDTLQQHSQARCWQLQQQWQACRKGDDGSDVKRNRCTLQQLFHLPKVAVADEEAGLVVIGPDVDPGCGYANSRLDETAVLTRRYLKNVFRTKELFACRTIQMLVSGVVLGSIFHDLKDDAGGARERVGLFAFVLTFLLGCTTEALPIFLQEREILMKETSCGSYRVSSYAIANGLVFLPFLLILAVLFSVPLYWLVGLNRGLAPFLYFLLLIWLVLYTANSVVACFAALAPNFIVGNSMISGVLGAFFLFSGYFIRKEGMPSYWVFMHYVSLFKYPFEGLLVNEFSDPGKCLDYRGGLCLVNGEEVLRQVGLANEGRWRNVAIMVCFILAYRFLSYIILRCRCSCAQRGGLRRALA